MHFFVEPETQLHQMMFVHSGKGQSLNRNYGLCKRGCSVPTFYDFFFNFITRVQCIQMTIALSFSEMKTRVSCVYFKENTLSRQR